MQIKTITPQDLYRRLKLGHNAVLLDVRLQAEYERGHIPGANLQPLQSFDAANIIHKACAPFAVLPTAILPTIYVICASGPESMKACQLLADAGYEHIINLEGGMRAWIAEGLPIKKIGYDKPEKNDIAIPPEQSQTNPKMAITIGSVMTIATLLGTFMNTGFLVVPFLAGVGFIYEGLFGTDYLKRTLLKQS